MKIGEVRRVVIRLKSSMPSKSATTGKLIVKAGVRLWHKGALPEMMLACFPTKLNGSSRRPGGLNVSDEEAVRRAVNKKSH